MKKFYLFFTLFVLALVITIFVLAYNIPGTNTTVLWTLFLPLVVVRFIRTILLIKS